MRVHFPGGKQVAAVDGDFEVRTDQPEKNGGAATAPAPFDLFLASLATCTGYYVLEFCQQRGIPTEGITIEQVTERDPETRTVLSVHERIRLPEAFPAKYSKAIVRAAEACTVKKVLERPPAMHVTAERA